MPSTGQYVAKKIGMTDFTPDKLSDLQTNLVLGSNYLNMVLNDLDGSWGLASAAYNAGPSRPKQWRQTLTKPVSMEIFVETIPFTETRTYVKNVLSNAVYYEILSTGKPQSIKAKLGTVNPREIVFEYESITHWRLRFCWTGVGCRLGSSSNGHNDHYSISPKS